MQFVEANFMILLGLDPHADLGPLDINHCDDVLTNQKRITDREFKLMFLHKVPPRMNIGQCVIARLDTRLRASRRLP